MAIVSGPLMSLGARGKIAGALVFSAWKGLKTARQYVVPANPRSAAQLAQRSLFTAAVSFWRGFLTNAVQRTGWDKAAGLSGSPQSGFNLYQSANLTLAATDPDGSMAISAADATADTVAITVANIDDGATGDEAGDFDVMAGSLPNDLLLIGSSAISAGVVSQDLGAPGDYYVQLTKGGIARSGVFAVTVTT